MQITEVFDTYATLKKANRSGEIAIKTLPKEIQPTLKVFDVDGDGTVAPMELARGAELYLESKKMVKKLTRLAAALLLLMGIMLAAITGLVFTVVELSKETKIEGGVTLDKATGLPTASAGLSDASGVTKTADNKTASAAVNAVPAALSSLLPDEAFDEMRYLRVENEEAKLVLQITGWARFFEGDGSSVVLQTHIGQVTITGRQLSFSSQVAPLFENAGFALDASGRRLASLYDLVGLFNKIDAFEGMDEDDGPMPSFPPSFYVEYEMYYACVKTGPESSGRDRCLSLHDHIGDFPAENYRVNMSLAEDATEAQSNYIRSVKGRMWMEGGRAFEVKESTLFPEGYVSVTFFDPGDGDSKADDRKAAWMVNPDRTDFGLNYDISAFGDDPLSHPTFPGVIQCKLEGGDDADLSFADVLATHSVGYYDGEMSVSAERLAQHGYAPDVMSDESATLRKFRIEGDENIQYLQAFLFDQEMSDGSYIPRRVSNQLNGESTVFVLTCMDSECDGRAADFDLASFNFELPGGCDAPAITLLGSGTTPFRGTNPFPPGSIGDGTSEGHRKLASHIRKEQRRVSMGQPDAGQRRLLMEGHVPGRLTENGIEFASPLDSGEEILTLPLDQLTARVVGPAEGVMASLAADGADGGNATRHLLAKADNKLLKLWKAAGKGHFQVQASHSDLSAHCKPRLLTGIELPKGLAMVYGINHEVEDFNPNSYPICLVQIEGEIQKGPLAFGISLKVDVDPKEGFAGAFEVKGEGQVKVGLWEVGIPVVTVGFLGGMQGADAHPCSKSNICQGSASDQPTIGYIGASGQINVVGFWGNFEYNYYFPSKLDNRKMHLLKGDINGGVNVGFFQVGVPIWDNHNDPLMWYDDEEAQETVYFSGNKLNIGDDCGWNDNAACFTGVCCPCYYGAVSNNFCDTKESYYGYCEGSHSIKLGGNPFC